MEAKEIYKQLNDKPQVYAYSLFQLLEIFENENSWIGHPLQMENLRQLSHEITGIRPGNCSGCNIEVLGNLIRWKNNYINTLKPKKK